MKNRCNVIVVPPLLGLLPLADAELLSEWAESVEASLNNESRTTYTFPSERKLAIFSGALVAYPV